VGALLAAFGIVLNRMNVVLFAQTFKGPMPGFRPLSYMPSLAEWGISIGLIAATIFLFGLAARLMPVLSKAQPSEGH
jgi:formate dehydrogenase iron-sulfur subunit